MRRSYDKPLQPQPEAHGGGARQLASAPSIGWCRTTRPSLVRSKSGAGDIGATPHRTPTSIGNGMFSKRPPPSQRRRAPPDPHAEERPPKTLIETKADVAAEIAPEHHQTPLMARTRGFADNFARDLIEATRDVPQEPKASRRLRLALAVTEIAPAVPVGVVLRVRAGRLQGRPAA